MLDFIVTGAAGFIGQALCKRLERDGASVLRLQHSDGCVSDSATWDGLPPARTLIHLAGRSYVPQSWNDPADFMRTNVVGTENAVQYCRRHNAALVFSSAYVYGIPQRLPIAESDTPRPNNPYALSKLLAEQLCEFAARIHGMPVSVLRLFNVFGPGQRAEFLIPHIVNQVLHAEQVEVLDLSPRRDYVFIDDVVDAFVKAGTLSDGYRCVNIGSGVSYSVQDVIDAARELAGKDIPVRSAAVVRQQEIPDVRADISMARQELGWTPATSLRDGIAEILTRSQK